MCTRTVLVVGLAAALFAWGCGGDESADDAETQGPEEIELDDTLPGQMIVAEGALWMRRGDGNVERRDLESGELVATIPIEGRYSDYLDYGEGRIWVSGNPLVSVDPATNRPGTRIRLAKRDTAVNPRDLAAGFGRVWHADFDTGEVRVFDAETGREEKPPIEAGEGATEVQIGRDAVWVGNLLGDSVTRIDPESREAEEVPLGEAAYADLVAGDQGVFAGMSDGSVVRLDPATGEPAARADALPKEGEETVGVDDMALDGKSLWVVGELSSQLVELNAETLEPVGDPQTVGPEGGSDGDLPSIEVAAGEGTLWASWEANDTGEFLYRYER